MNIPIEEVRELWIDGELTVETFWIGKCENGHTTDTARWSDEGWTKEQAERVIESAPFCEKDGTKKHVEEFTQKSFMFPSQDYEKTEAFLRKYFPEKYEGELDT